MATRKTLNFLPSIFRTDTNRKFLGATLDQLISEPQLTSLSGFVGRKFSATYPRDNRYITESAADRQNYQFEPATVVKNRNNYDLYCNYPDLINQINYHGGITTNHTRLFESEYYSYDPNIDLDKFVNYSQYYWVPQGTNSVTVSSGYDTGEKTFVFTRTGSGYTTTLTGNIVNPELTLVRGIQYTFQVNQTGHNFYLQTEPGLTGTKQYNLNVSTRQIQGLTGNNGIQTGTFTFTPPAVDLQDYYFELPDIDYVDYATTQTFSELDGKTWNTGINPVTEIDGSSQFPRGRYVVFLASAANNTFWVDYLGNIVSQELRKGLWRIDLDDNSVIRLHHVRDIPVGYRLKINQGSNNAGVEFFKNTSGEIVKSPAITSAYDTYYYQDGSNSAYSGRIRIVDAVTGLINVDNDIIGETSYTSPRGIKFTNGLRITFDTSVLPIEYQNKTYIVEGVGTGIKLVDVSLIQSIEDIGILTRSVPFDSKNYDIGAFDEIEEIPTTNTPDYVVMHRTSQDLNAWVRANHWVHQDVIEQVANYNGVVADYTSYTRAQRPIIEFKPNLQLFNSGRVFLSFVDRYDEYLIGTGPITTWPSLTDAFAQLNNVSITDVSLANMNFREGQRTVFPNDTDDSIRSRVYEIRFKDQSTASIFDATGTGNISCSTSSRFVTGVSGATNFTSTLKIGSSLYTTAGAYIGKVKQIFNSSRLELESNANLTSTSTGYKINFPIIELIAVTVAQQYDSIVVKTGYNAKKTYWFNGSSWQLAQLKTKKNQAILFDIIDSNGQSVSGYTDSTFAGTRIFGYRSGSSLVDPVLGLQLSYNSVGTSIADINYDNAFDVDTYTYVVAGVTKQAKVNTGFIRVNNGRTNYTVRNVWQTVLEPTKQFQHFTGTYDGITNYFEIDIKPDTPTNERNIKVYVNNESIPDSDYQVLDVFERSAVRILTTLPDGAQIDILIYSKNSVSATAYYEIPVNLEFNPLNAGFSTVTLGQIRTHCYKIIDNSNENVQLAIRDRDLTGSPGTILQHSSSIPAASVFLSDKEINFVNSIDYARREYTKFKSKFLDLATKLTLNLNDIAGSVDIILDSINQVKNSSFPWYYSDMVPATTNFLLDRYKIINPAIKTYNLTNIYQGFGRRLVDITTPSSQAILVYLNNNQLMYGRDYTFGSSSSALTISNSITLTAGDILTVRGYTNTAGSYVPETPTKLGLHPKFIPEKYLDNTYRTPINVIQGHDGSLIPAFEDYRDDLLLELEKRIYNNIKTEFRSDLINFADVIPGKFRNTDYSLTEFNRVLTLDFLRWTGANQLDYSSNDNFQSNDQFSWNYNLSSDAIDGELLPGYWRGVYKYFYDTDRPHTHPWEMLGYAQRPTWWVTHYGAAPYTSTNTLMWADLMAGYSRGTASTDLRYARPNLTKFIPVNAQGQLLPPTSIVTGSFNGSKFSQSYTVGDHSPVETAWRRSSEYPFALQRTLALLKPVKYFGLVSDSVNVVRDTSLGQYINRETNQRISVNNLKLNGETVNGVATYTYSYTNWVHGYLTSLGLDAITVLRNKLQNLDVKLSYKMAGYTDKKYITVQADQFSPESTNRSVVIPDENYSLYLNKSVPRRRAVYSAVIVEKTSTGYSVSGYDLENPFFTVIPSDFKGKFYSLQVLTARALIFQDFTNLLVTVPYGFEFTSTQEVVDFLIGYQRYLQYQGFAFDDYQSDLAQVKDWVLSAREFLTWTLQDWQLGSVIVLSPVSDTLKVLNDSSVIDEITNKLSGTRVLSPGFKVIPLSDISIVRDTELTTIKTFSGQTITYIDLNLVQYEHVLILDNETVFKDVIFKPELGSRQYRIKLTGNKTSSWDGSLYAPGFVYTSGEVPEWQAGTDYFKGDLVEYKKQIYVALENLIASDTFNFNQWTRSDITPSAGLLPNFSRNAVVAQDYYNVDSLILDENIDKFSKSLIGFRNRTNLENLGIDQVSQSKFYQGYIKDKGSVNAIRALYSGVFDGVNNSVNVFEEWGVRVGEYGDTRNKKNLEVVLDENRFSGNPTAFKFGATSTIADNLLGLTKKDLYSYAPDFNNQVFLNRDLTAVRETDILTAGYVNEQDIDAQLFDFVNFRTLNSQILTDIVDGYRIWVAKDFGEQWQVYKAHQTDNTILQIEYSLDNKAKITFKYEHGLQTGQVFAIRNFDSGFDGFYQVLNIEEHNTVIVTIDEAQINLLTEALVAEGEFIYLMPQRYQNVAQRNYKISAAPRQLGDLAWVDSNVNVWQVQQLTSDYTNNFSGTQHTWEIDSGVIHIRASGLPYHSTGSNIATPAVEQNYSRIWPFNGGANVAATSSPSRSSGVIGFWLNGVAIVSPDLADFVPEGYQALAEFNYNLGYTSYSNVSVDLATGVVRDNLQYVYVGNPTTAWLTGVGNVSATVGVAEVTAINYYDGSLVHADGHSKILGFAADGYPIYGPFGYIVGTDSASGIRRMASGYVLKNSSYRVGTEASDTSAYPMGIFVNDYEYSGLGDLDQHNGRYCVTPDYPNGTYAYFITTDSNSNLVYPYVIGNTFYGELPEVVNSRISGSGIPPTTFQTNLTNNNVWTTLRQQQPTVENASVASLYLYDLKLKTLLATLDFIDPVKGKILGVAQDDLDFISAYDPARYNTGTRTDVTIDSNYHWGNLQVGMIWWDIDQVRYCDYEQDSLDYRLANWGRTFPGSTISIAEWVASSVLPSEYVAAGLDGVPKFADDSAYVEEQFVDETTGVIRTRYYYWVTDRAQVSPRNKKLSVINIAQMIANPIMQNIPYAAVLSDRSLALFNIDEYINGSNCVLNIGYKTNLTDNVIFSEYELMQEGNPASRPNARVEQKLIDSLIGFDVQNNSVPDLTLPLGSKFGLGVTPEQTVVSDRYLALENILTYVNGVLIKHPVASRLTDRAQNYTDNLFALDPEPAASSYDLRVNTLEEFGYVAAITSGNLVPGQQYVIKSTGNTSFTAIGASANTPGTVFTANAAGAGTGQVYPRRILVASNAEYRDYWTVITKQADGQAGGLLELQTFDTRRFWNYADWYATGYSSATASTYTVNQYTDIYKLSLSLGDIIKVNNDLDNFELYEFNGSDLVLIGLGRGTIQFSSDCWKRTGYDIEAYDTDIFDFDNALELRYIFKAIKEDLFTLDLASYYNEFIFNIIKYVLIEQRYVDWVFKSSFISVLHRIDSLTQDRKYIKDRQQNYQQYVEEVKPYRTKIREYVLSYENRENFDTLAVSDFDLPAYYDASLDIFRSPNGQLGSQDDELLSTDARYLDWYNNHRYEISELAIASGGSGHLTAPTVSIIARDTSGNLANATTQINSNGTVISTTMTNFGQGYTRTPIVVVTGTGTTEYSNVAPTVLSPRVRNNKIRKLNTTLRFDRVQYDTAVVAWQANVNLTANAVVSYQGRAYRALSNLNTGLVFDRSQYTPVASAAFNNANDRITAFYQPTADMIPLDLSRLISGITVPQVDANLGYELDTLVAGGGFTGTSIPATQLAAGEKYIITSITGTDFTAVGAVENRVGLVFTATGPATGTGTAALAIGSSALGNIAGIATEDIILNGGAFVDEILSRAPEELLPGITYDTVSIKVVTDGVSGNIGYRRFVDMNGGRITTEINTATITTLAQPLLLTDSTIVLTNASAFPVPSPISLQPGILHIDGERIEYYTKNGNVLGQIRRGVGGTAIAQVHASGTVVESATTEITVLTQ